MQTPLLQPDNAKAHYGYPNQKEEKELRYYLKKVTVLTITTLIATLTFGILAFEYFRYGVIQVISVGIIGLILTAKLYQRFQHEPVPHDLEPSKKYQVRFWKGLMLHLAFAFVGIALSPLIRYHFARDTLAPILIIVTTLIFITSYLGLCMFKKSSFDTYKHCIILFGGSFLISNGVRLLCDHFDIVSGHQLHRWFGLYFYIILGVFGAIHAFDLACSRYECIEGNQDLLNNIVELYLIGTSAWKKRIRWFYRKQVLSRNGDELPELQKKGESMTVIEL